MTMTDSIMVCDKCGHAMETSDGFALWHGILGGYRVCTGCSLALDKFVESIDRAQARRAKRRHATDIR